MRENLTESDVKKIEAEIEDRILNQRPQLIQAVKEARAQGDLSENFEYYAAKREKNINESRIRYLQRMLNMAEVIEDDTNDDEIGINNEFTIEYIEDGGMETFKLVTGIRSSSLKNYISIESPMGKALKGKKVGDVATIKVSEEYSYDVRVIDISEDLGDDDDAIREY